MLPNNKNYFKVMLSGLASLVKEGKLPADVIRAVLWQWVAKVTPSITLTASKTPSLISETSVNMFADWLGESEILIGAFWLSSAFAALIAKEQRKASAMYFTPPYLSNRMLDNAGQHLFTGKIVDPACGGAAFLAPAALRIAKEMADKGNSSKEILSHIESNLYGVDTEPFLCELSLVFLRMVLAEHIINVGEEPQFNVICGDGLSALGKELQTFDLVLSNPPYRKMIRDEVKPLLEVYGSIIEGQPNLYSIFIKRASILLKPKGKAVLLTPMSFLSGKSFANLRHDLVTNGCISQLDLIHDKSGVFLEAEQDAVVTVWEKSKKQNRPAAVYSLSLGGSAKFTGRLAFHQSESPWVAPRKIEDAELISLFSNSMYTLQKYGYRPKTGAIVVHRDKRPRYASIAQAAYARKALPLIWQRDIGTNGTLQFADTKDAPDQYIDMGTLNSASIVKQPAVVMQRVTSANQARRLVCAPISKKLINQFGGVTGENHVCFIVQSTEGVLVDPEMLSSILRTKTLDRIFRCISGATNVSSYELNNLPLPDPTILKHALKEGRSIEEATRIGLGLTPTALEERN